MKVTTKTKIIRRLGMVLWPRYSKYFLRRPYPPGQKPKRKKTGLSEFGRQLQEKQKLRYLYYVSDNYLRNLVKSIITKKTLKEDPSQILLKNLEMRLDNVVLKSGFANSIFQAAQFVSHRHIKVNGKKLNIRSYRVKVGDVISFSDKFKKSKIFQEIAKSIEKYNAPNWIEVDKKNLTAKILREPTLEDVKLPVELSAVFEFYSK